MRSVNTLITMQVSPPDGMAPMSADDMVKAGDALMEALLRLEAVDPTITDSSVALDLDLSQVEVGVTVEAADFDEAAAKATSVIRTAVHDIGHATPGWEIDVQSRQQDLIDC